MKLVAIYVPSLNVCYSLEGTTPEELTSVPFFKATEIHDRSQEFDDHTEYFYEVVGTTFTRTIIDVPVILFTVKEDEAK